MTSDGKKKASDSSTGGFSDLAEAQRQRSIESLRDLLTIQLGLSANGHDDIDSMQAAVRARTIASMRMPSTSRASSSRAAQPAKSPTPYTFTDTYPFPNRVANRPEGEERSVDTDTRRSRPKRCAQSVNTWWCCKCQYCNKSGKFLVCSNPDFSKCGKKIPHEEQMARPLNKQMLNHERCTNCTPSFGEKWEEGHASQFWQPMDGMKFWEKQEVDIIAENELTRVSRDYFDKVIKDGQAKFKSPPVERNPLTGLRVYDHDGNKNFYAGSYHASLERPYDG